MPRWPQAAGTVDTLRELGAQHGMRVQVMDLLGDASNADGNVSSSEVAPFINQHGQAACTRAVV